MKLGTASGKVLLQCLFGGLRRARADRLEQLAMVVLDPAELCVGALGEAEREPQLILKVPECRQQVSILGRRYDRVVKGSVVRQGGDRVVRRRRALELVDMRLELVDGFWPFRSASGGL